MITRRAAADNDKALAAYLAAKAEIDAMLSRLQALSDDHFGTRPDEIDWGDVGTLQHYAGLLRQITDSALREGEHAA
ncbi:MAG TPA: hypothetical protein GXX24_02225 [Paracoccus solventivorans]|uniref:Uncharacterized protein n=2 Tax=Paracoccus solventivorans TaxID=53463 RepID=A0A832PL62_9RHOB|nr:hypothetical protein [Paracoccus solventivorans]